MGCFKVVWVDAEEESGSKTRQEPEGTRAAQAEKPRIAGQALGASRARGCSPTAVTCFILNICLQF